MKICISFFLAFSFLLVSSDAAPEAVRDIDGNILRARVAYFILPVLRPGAGLTLANLGNELCHPIVAQELLGVSLGIPVTFLPVNLTSLIVRTATDQNVRFLTTPLCGKSTVWKLDAFDESTGQYFVTVGGVEGIPGPETTGNWFKIERSGQDYKLVFCPTVCDVCKVICSDIGIYVKDDGTRFLALSENPFMVRFRRA